MIRYSLLVMEGPTQGQAGLSALRFAEAALARGHVIAQVFFYGEGAAALLRGAVPSDEIDVVAALGELAERHGFPMRACSAAAERRGYARDARAGDAPVDPGTLGQLMVGLDAGDRLVSFAN